MKRLQVAIQKVYAIEVEDDFYFTDESEVCRLIEEDIVGNNQTISNEFFENLTVVCADCGISLNLDEEKKNGICEQCNNN